MQHVPPKLDEDFIKQLADLSFDELMALEDAIASVLRKKRADTGMGDWQKDFLSISTWTHLDESTLPEIGPWPIETF